MQRSHVPDKQSLNTRTMIFINKKHTIVLFVCLLASRVAATGLRGATESLEDYESNDSLVEVPMPVLRTWPEDAVSRSLEEEENEQHKMVHPVKDYNDNSNSRNNISNHLVAEDDPVIGDEFIILRHSGKMAGPISKVKNSTLHDPVERHLADTTVEYHTVLIVRINNPSVSEAQMRSAVHSDVKRQMEVCSQGLVRILPPRYGLPAVLNVGIGMSVTYANMDSFAAEGERAAEQLLSNRYKLRDVADHILFVMPYIPDFSAKGELGTPQSWRAGAEGLTSKYTTSFAPSLSILMHELGHNLGLHHAGFQSDSYGDITGYMGYSTNLVGSPQKCYNAGNHWELGWFPDAKLEMQPPTVPQIVTVIAFTDYLQRLPNDKVLVRVGNLFMQYNRRKSYNIGTSKLPDMLVIVKGGTYNSQGRTYLQGGIDVHTPTLTSDQYDTTNDVQIRVCKQYVRPNGVDVMEISIGRLGTNCNISPPPPPPQYRPTPVTHPTPTPPRPTIWYIRPSPPTPPYHPTPVTRPAPTPPRPTIWYIRPSPPTPPYRPTPVTRPAPTPPRPTIWYRPTPVTRPAPTPPRPTTTNTGIWKVSVTGGNGPPSSTFIKTENDITENGDEYDDDDDDDDDDAWVTEDDDAADDQIIWVADEDPTPRNTTDGGI